MVSDIMTREIGIWNKEALIKHVPHLVEEILLIKPSSSNAADSYKWLLNRSGEYSSKSGYLALHLTETNAAGTAHFPDDFNWYKSVWSPTILPKIQLFLWKVLQGAIPTGENLQRRGLLTDTNCIRCGAQETTKTFSFTVILRDRYGTSPPGLHLSQSQQKHLSDTNSRRLDSASTFLQ